MKKFSKNDFSDSAICNYCGQWRKKPANLTNQQLEEMDWKCDECKAKENPQPKPQPEVPTEQERGSKEVSKYDPEYSFLVTLVKLLVKEGVSPQEIKSIAAAYPFVTIDDVGDLTAKLWTLATEKYHIPREWLIKRLPKNANLKIATSVIRVNTRNGEEFRIYKNPTMQQISNLANNVIKGDVRIFEYNGENYAWDALKATHLQAASLLGINPNELRESSFEIINSGDRWDEKKQMFVGLESDPSHVPEEIDVERIKYNNKLKGNNAWFYLDENNEWQGPMSYGRANAYKNRVEKKLDKTVKSAGQVTADLWPAQEAAENTLSHEHNSLSYNPLQEADTSACGPNPNEEIPCPNCGRLREYADVVQDGMCDQCNSKTAKKKSLNIDRVVQILNGKEPRVVRVDPVNFVVELEDGTVLSFDEATKMAITMEKTADGFTGAEFSTDDFGVNPTMDSGPWSSPEDQGARPQKSPFPNTSWLPADDENLDEQPWSNVASTIKRSFSKKANPNARYWIAPDGKVFPVTGVHGSWTAANPDVLKQYGIKPATDRYGTGRVWDDMAAAGWVRVSNEPAGTGFQIQVPDINNIPPFVDDFIAQHYTRGDVILIGNGRDQGVEVYNPFPSIQKAVNRALRMKQTASLKQAHCGPCTPLKMEAIKMLSDAQYKNPKLGLDAVLSGLAERSTDLDLQPFLHQFETALKIFEDSSEQQDSDVHKKLAQIFFALSEVNKRLHDKTFDAVDKPAKQAFSKKEADLSGQVVNQIVNAIHADGGVTWSLSKGDMVGTDNYAVAVYPERAQILDEADFENIEQFITANSDLLNNPENSFGAWSHDGKVYLDVVATIPDVNQAIELGKQHNQIAIWDLKNAKEIQTGGTGEVKQAAQKSILPQQFQDEIAAETSPVYNIALTNYAEAVKRGHERNRSLEYAIESVANLEKIDPKKLVELINRYL
jgi:hypothetical protein